MHEAVNKALVMEFKSRGTFEEGPLRFQDTLVSLIHHEMTREDDGANPRTTIGEFVDLLNDEFCEEETIHEYCLLKKHFLSRENIFTRIMLLRGLHHHPRNREWINAADPLSVERNAALLRAVILTRMHAKNERTLNDMLAYYDYGDKGYYGQSIREEEVANLIMDHPQHVDTFINLIIDRGYRVSIAVFRDMMKNGVPVFNNGVL
jgi:hypothetical protein